jgi:hypothetical protein
MAKKDKVNAAYGIIMGEQKKGAKVEKTNPVGVALTVDEVTRLGVIAGELGVSRHAVLQYAVREFIARYDQGERPKTETKSINKLVTG